MPMKNATCDLRKWRFEWRRGESNPGPEALP
jgi:hypothetical protein